MRFYAALGGSAETVETLRQGQWGSDPGAVAGRADAHPTSLMANREKARQSSLSLLPDRLGEGAPAGTDRDNDHGGRPHRRQGYAVHAADELVG